MFFLFLPLKKKKNQQQNQNENQSRQTLNKKKKKINWQEIIKQNKKLPENGACVVFTGACTGVWLIFSVMPLWSKLIFPFPAGVSYKYLLSQGQDFSPFSEFLCVTQSRDFVSFEPMRVLCILSRSCASILLHLEDNSSLESSITSDCYNFLSSSSA